MQVTERELLGLTLEPEKVALAVGDKLLLRAMGKLPGDRSVELSPDVLQADHLPLPRYAEFNRKTLEIAGLEATDSSRPQSLALRCDAQQASAAVEISPPVAELEIVAVTPGLPRPRSQSGTTAFWQVPPPCRLDNPCRVDNVPARVESRHLPAQPLAETANIAGTAAATGPAAPTGPIDLPLGQQVQLQAWATFRDGHREQVPGDRVALEEQSADRPTQGISTASDRWSPPTPRPASYGLGQLVRRLPESRNHSRYRPRSGKTASRSHAQ